MFMCAVTGHMFFWAGLVLRCGRCLAVRRDLRD